MNQDLKQLILDICKNYTVHDHGLALTVTGGQFRITLDKQYPVRPIMQIMVNMKNVYSTYFNIDGDTALDKDITTIYRAMQEKLRQQQRDQANADPYSIKAVKQLREALLFDKTKGK